MYFCRLIFSIANIFMLIHSTATCEKHQWNKNDSEMSLIPYSTRIYWMRKANEALKELASACPFAAFGTVIVNHTSTGPHDLGDMICMGVNQNAVTGNPIFHGEMVAITNCTNILTDKNGKYRLSRSEVGAAFGQLSLYTNAESCPMVMTERLNEYFSKYINKYILLFVVCYSYKIWWI